jgi:hypothetical protein
MGDLTIEEQGLFKKAPALFLKAGKVHRLLSSSNPTAPIALRSLELKKTLLTEQEKKPLYQFYFLAMKLACIEKAVVIELIAPACPIAYSSQVPRSEVLFPLDNSFIDIFDSNIIQTT